MRLLSCSRLCVVGSHLFYQNVFLSFATFFFPHKKYKIMTNKPLCCPPLTVVSEEPPFPASTVSSSRQSSRLLLPTQPWPTQQQQHFGGSWMKTASARRSKLSLWWWTRWLCWALAPQATLKAPCKLTCKNLSTTAVSQQTWRVGVGSAV